MRRSKERQGIVRISSEDLLEIMGFTAGELLDIRLNFERKGMVELRMNHPYMPVHWVGDHFAVREYVDMKDKGEL